MLVHEKWENPFVPLPNEPLLAAIAAFIGVPINVVRKSMELHGEMALQQPIDRAIRAFVVTYNRGLAHGDVT